MDGRIVISRALDKDGNQAIYLTVHSEDKADFVFQGHMSLEDFSYALTGRGAMSVIHIDEGGLNR